MAFDTRVSFLANLADDFKLGLFGSVQPLVEEALHEADRWHKRKRSLPAPLMVWFVTLLVLFRELSIPDVHKVMVNALRGRRSIRLKQVTPEALCHARERLGSAPLQALFEKLAESATPDPSFHGLRVWGVDGAQFKVPDTPANDAAFGRPASSRGETAFPQLQGVFLVATRTHQVRDATFGPCGRAERPEAEALLRHLGSQDLVLMDRGFAAGWLFESFLAKGVHFGCRIPSNWKCDTIQVLGPGDFLVRVNTQAPSPADREEGAKSRRRVIVLRMIKYRVGTGEWIRMVTDLKDPVRYPARELAALYHERWESELVYDEFKNHLATVPKGTLQTPFRSKAPDGVLQESYGLLVTYNLVRSLMIEAADTHDIPPLEISFVGTLRVLRMALPNFQTAPQAGRTHERLRTQLLKDVADCQLDRPRRPRSYPRKAKIKMSNFQVKGPEDKQQRLDPETQLELAS